MPYTSSKDPGAQNGGGLMVFGRKGRVISPSNTVDLDPYAKAIVVTAAGNLVIIPVGNEDADTITFTAAPLGFSPPYRVRRVLATGTTASCATVDD
jgi:hypothetical protein